MAQEKLKLPRSSYEELCKIIKAYGRLEQPGPLEQVTTLSGIGKTNVSANNFFLTTVGIIQGGKMKEATPLGRELAQALEHNIPETISGKWREVVQKSDFLNKMALAVKIRNGMEASSLETHIAYSAGEPKSSSVMTGARAVIDILRSSGLVREEGDKIVPGEPISIVKTPEETVSVPVSTAPPSLHREEILLRDFARSAGKINLNIELRIDAKPSELEGLGAKLKDLLRSLSEVEGEDHTK